jgi:hypothetical protein
MKKLEDYIAELNLIFDKNTDRYKAHELSQPILLKMAEDKSIINQIIARNIVKPGFFEQKRITPVIAFEIEVNDVVSFIAHCWLPQPDLDTEISNQSIHHHGDLILTSVAAWGSGYESILFKKGIHIDKKTHETTFEIEKIYKNPYMNIEFIDVNTAHIVFYPNELSITYALWTNHKSKSAEKLRSISFLQKNRKKIRKIIDYFNLAKIFNLNSYQFVDFYPKSGKIYAMKNRIRYTAGGHDSFAHGLFKILSETKFQDYNLLKANLGKSNVENVELYKDLLNRLNKNEPISDKFEEIHMNIPKVNIKKSEILACFNV